MAVLENGGNGSHITKKKHIRDLKISGGIRGRRSTEGRVTTVILLQLALHKPNQLIYFVIVLYTCNMCNIIDDRQQYQGTYN